MPFLFSGQFYKLLDSTIQKRCRHIDQVLLKGSSQPIDLYTFDISPGWKKAFLNAAGSNPSTPSTKSGPSAPNYGKLRSDWLHEVASINFKVPTRKPSNASTTSNDAAAATASSATTGDTASSIDSTSDDSTNANSSTSMNASHDHDHPTQPSNSDVPSNRNSPTSVGSPPQVHRDRKDSDPHVTVDSTNADLIAHLNTLLAQLQSDLPPNYVELFNRGIKCYLHGDWQIAGKYLVKFQALHREKVASQALPDPLNGTSSSKVNGLYRDTIDGPSNQILQFMGKHAFQAPKGWKGYRKLSKK